MKYRLNLVESLALLSLVGIAVCFGGYAITKPAHSPVDASSSLVAFEYASNLATSIND